MAIPIKAKRNNKACEFSPTVLSNEQIKANPNPASKATRMSLEKLTSSGTRTNKRVYSSSFPRIPIKNTKKTPIKT